MRISRSGHKFTIQISPYYRYFSEMFIPLGDTAEPRVPRLRAAALVVMKSFNVCRTISVDWRCYKLQPNDLMDASYNFQLSRWFYTGFIYSLTTRIGIPISLGIEHRGWGKRGCTTAGINRRYCSFFSFFLSFFPVIYDRTFSPRIIPPGFSYIRKDGDRPCSSAPRACLMWLWKANFHKVK